MPLGVLIMLKQDTQCLISRTMTLMLGLAISATMTPPALLHVQIPSLILLPLNKVDVRVIKPPFITVIM